MKNILVIGATGQIGSELTMELRKRYGNTHVVAGYIHGAEPKGELKESGPSAVVDVTDQDMIASVVREYNIDTILQSRRPAVCCSRVEAEAGLENRYRRFVECT